MLSVAPDDFKKSIFAAIESGGHDGE